MKLRINSLRALIVILILTPFFGGIAKDLLFSLAVVTSTLLLIEYFRKINYKVSLYSLAKNLSILNVSPICYGIEEIDGATYDEISETEGSELIAPWSFNSTRLTGLI